MMKLRLFSKFMTPQSNKQRISIPILPNISKSKGNHARNFGQLIEYNVINNFQKKYQADKKAEKFLKRSKQVFSTLVLLYFGRPPIGHAIKTNFITFKTVDLKIFSILIFHKRV